MSESQPITALEAIQRLHDALPSHVSFAVYRHDTYHVQCDCDGLRDPARSSPGEPEWSVVVQQHSPIVGSTQYLHASLGRDLAAVVEEAIRRFRAMGLGEGEADAPEATATPAPKPAKLTAPGSADENEVAARNRRVS